MNDPATYRPLLETVFHAEHDGRLVALRLAEVADGRVGRGIEQFSLFFHGPSDQLLPQGTYAMRHDSLGSLALFIVPILGSNAERIIYQACFSRPIPAPPAP